MNTIKKTIFLSNKDNNHKNTMATLTLERKQKSIYCTFKSYNLSTPHELILGIKSDNQIIKQNIINNNPYNFILNKDIDLDQNLGCVLLECDKQNITPILWGNEKNINYKQQIVDNLKSSIQKIKTFESPHNTIKEDVKKTDIHPAQQPIFSNKDFISPVHRRETYEIHKNPFNINNYIEQEEYSQISLEDEFIKTTSTEIAQASMEALFESNDTEIEKTIDDNTLNINGAEHKFYNMIAKQLDEIFDNFPRETNLEKLIDNSKWVRINHEEENRYYVVGIIYEEKDIKYICYGVPGDYYNEPPMHMRKFSQWLPTDSLNPYDNGYWVMYQDSDTGENIVIN